MIREEIEKIIIAQSFADPQNQTYAIHYYAISKAAYEIQKQFTILESEINNLKKELSNIQSDYRILQNDYNYVKEQAEDWQRLAEERKQKMIDIFKELKEDDETRDN